MTTIDLNQTEIGLDQTSLSEISVEVMEYDAEIDVKRTSLNKSNHHISVMEDGQNSAFGDKTNASLILFASQ